MPLTRQSHVYKSHFEEWAEVTGWHGVLDFFYAKTIVLKFVWGLVIGLGCFLAISQSYSFLRDFMEEDKWVTSVTYETPEGGVLEWPNITLCSLNWLAKSKLSDQGLHNPYAIEYAANRDEGVEFYRLMQDGDHAVDNVNYRSFVRGSNVTSRYSIMQKLARTCADTVLVCGYSREFDLENGFRHCCTNSIPSEGFSCFKVNTMAVFQKQNQFDAAGYHGGIYFILDARPSDDYEEVLFLERPSSGFKITLYFGESDTDALSPSLFFGPATHSVISIQAEKTRTKSRATAQGGVRFYDSPLPCRKDAGFEYMDSEVYTSALCQSDCVARYMMDECNCTLQYENLKNASRCDSTDLECASKYTELNNSSFQKSRLIVSRRGFNMSQCINECLEPCEHTSVAAKISSAQFPTPKKAEALTTYVNRALNLSVSREVVEQYTLLEIYYETNQYRVVEKMERVSADDLISSVGGTLGIWTGISIISIFQAIFYTVVGVRALVSRCISHRLRRRN